MLLSWNPPSRRPTCTPVRPCTTCSASTRRLRPSHRQAKAHLRTPPHLRTSAPPYLRTLRTTRPQHFTGERLPADGSTPGGQPWREYIASRVRASQLGQRSIARDAAYAEGQGNLTEALRLIRLQLELQPRHPRYLHDAATVQARRRYLGPSMARPIHPTLLLAAAACLLLDIPLIAHPSSTHPSTHQAVRSGVHPEAEAEALTLFAASQAAAAPAAAAFLRRERSDGCPRRTRLLDLGACSLGCSPSQRASSLSPPPSP